MNKQQNENENSEKRGPISGPDVKNQNRIQDPKKKSDKDKAIFNLNDKKNEENKLTSEKAPAPGEEQAP